jgi:Uncharacterized conserved protein
MSAVYIQKGEVLDYKNETTDVITASTIKKFGEKVGVIGGNIPPGETGAIHMVGVYQMPKTNNAETVQLGQSVYFDGMAITTTESGNTLAGYAVEESTTTQSTVVIKLVG